MEERSSRMGIKFGINQEREKKIPEEFKDLAKDFAEKGFITTSLIWIPLLFVWLSN